MVSFRCQTGRVIMTNAMAPHKGEDQRNNSSLVNTKCNQLLRRNEITIKQCLHYPRRIVIFLMECIFYLPFPLAGFALLPSKSFLKVGEVFWRQFGDIWRCKRLEKIIFFFIVLLAGLLQFCKYLYSKHNNNNTTNASYFTSHSRKRKVIHSCTLIDTFLI